MTRYKAIAGTMFAPSLPELDENDNPTGRHLAKVHALCVNEHGHRVYEWMILATDTPIRFDGASLAVWINDDAGTCMVG